MIESELIEAGTYQKQIPEQTREHILSSLLDHFTEISSSFFLSKIKAFLSSVTISGLNERLAVEAQAAAPGYWGQGQCVDLTTAAGSAALRHPRNLHLRSWIAASFTLTNGLYIT